MKTPRLILPGLVLGVAVFIMTACSPISVIPDGDSEDLVFSVQGGEYAEDIEVSISSRVEGADIYYTLDGTEPDENSELYVEPILIPGYGEEVTLKAVLQYAGSRKVSAAKETYKVKYTDQVATPKFIPDCKILTEPTDIEITCATPGATIYYTTDGSRPDENCECYTGPICLDDGISIQIKAIAVKEGMKNSPIKAMYYVIKEMKPSDAPILFQTNRDWECYPLLRTSGVDDDIEITDMEVALMDIPEEETGELEEDVSLKGNPNGQYVKELYSVKPNGTLLTRLTNAVYDNSKRKFRDFPGNSDWSPDRCRLVCDYMTDLYPSNLRRLFVMNNDGTGSYPITLNFQSTELNGVRWSPNGKKIVYSRTMSYSTGKQGIYVVHNNGYIEPVLERPFYLPQPTSPCWSPCSNKIAFIDCGRIYVMKANGTCIEEVPGCLENVCDLDWHPCMDKLLFSMKVGRNYEIFMMYLDGTHLIQLTDDCGDNRYPDWSPDGKFISFASDRTGNWEIFTMKMNGNNQTNITNNPACDTYPSW